MKSLVAILLLAGSAVFPTSTACAQEDLDSPAPKSKKKAARANDSVIREVERGVFVKSNIGYALYTQHFFYQDGTLLDGGTALGISVGQDFLDRDKFSLAWELSFNQTLNNGAAFDEQGALGLTAQQLTQGDIHTFGGIATIEASVYPSRRFGIGARVGGGLYLVPRLMYLDNYETEVITEAYKQRALVHDGPLPAVTFGPTFEYYTKLSHFSIGAEVDATLLLGFDLAIQGSGYLKYTF